MISNSTYGQNSGEVRVEPQTDICTPVFIAALLSTAKQGTQLSVHQGTDGQRAAVKLHKGIVSIVKRKEVLTSAMTRLNLEDTMLSDIGQTQRTNTV